MNPVPEGHASAVEAGLQPEGDYEDDCAPFGEGAYQVRILLIAVVAGGFCYIQWVLFRLSSRVMDHWCSRPPAFLNVSVDEWKKLAIPRDANGTYSRCTVREPPNAGIIARVVTCSSWEFDLGEYGNTIVSEWSIVCERRQLNDIARAAHYCATVFSLLVAGQVADRVGRTTVAIVALAGFQLTLLGSALATDFQTYVIMRSVTGATAGCLLPLYVILYEVTTTPRRLFYCVLAPALSTIFVPIFAFLIDFWKMSWSSSHLMLAVSAGGLLGTFYIIHESPSWLLHMHRTQDAESVALKAANVNGVSPSTCLEALRKEMRRRHCDEPCVEPNVETSCVDSCVWASSLRKRTILLAASWFIIGWTHSHYTLDRGIQVSDYVRIATYLGIGPTFIAIWSFLQRGKGVKRVIVTLTLVSSSSSSVLFFMYDLGATFPTMVVLTIMRLSVTVSLALIFFLALNIYPIQARCTGLCTGFAACTSGEVLGHLAFHRLLQSGEDPALVVTSILNAAAGFAVYHIPAEVSSIAVGAPVATTNSVSGASQVVPSSGERAPLADGTRVGQYAHEGLSTVSAQSLAVKKRRPGSEPMPEQFAVRPSKIFRELQ
ncbi:hypothetical protein HPB49_024207 [Dermacentor silvarum]|uniref:Uncharacterized protein n=1 Tax=Dermacentor silvarum TaxID=543639 RepID=A0ACB8D950_DERSI|nr:solute carrier family 22 member 7 [Dermacentor silvarum]KAH7960886.1 hypothetical protein HPB49_024207 [Dermacentor silvarum]